ncbi:hypothetical protein [Gellertiella hungarica]|uniref:Uncharacterized protein n=1 Tax=Gellertiella hungarica TaxID=1572859 RepID=A0A7W6J9A3_9HYPH|nr:hypothetical protein [Gellertiella hungarica]MBB4066243.1 hypothetical protein [Gellertiella hungarica]
MMNVHDADARLQLMMSACYLAVSEHFSHLAIRDIIDPPHGLFDALLARQVAITLMWDEFCVPRRRIAIMLNRQRGRICTITKIIEVRRECPVFDAAFLRMGKYAKAIFLREIKRDQVAA